MAICSLLYVMTKNNMTYFPNSIVYRVEVLPKQRGIPDPVRQVVEEVTHCRVSSMDMDDPYDLAGLYRVDTLPDWAQERLAVLMLTSHEPPTVEIDGVGRRINEYTYWICAPELVSTTQTENDDET